jgi:hypothetical protein
MGWACKLSQSWLLARCSVMGHCTEVVDCCQVGMHACMHSAWLACLRGVVFAPQCRERVQADDSVSVHAQSETSASSHACKHVHAPELTPHGNSASESHTPPWHAWQGLDPVGILHKNKDTHTRHGSHKLHPDSKQIHHGMHIEACRVVAPCTHDHMHT